MTPATSSVEPSEGRVSPEPLSLTQGLAHNRGFIIICQMSEEFSQPMPTGVGGCLASRGSSTDIPSCLAPTGVCTAPSPGDPQSELQRRRRKWGEGMER